MDYYQNEYNVPQNNNRPGGFEIASIACGIASLLCCCTGFFGIAFGALGIIFAVLTRRLGKPMSILSIVGLCISCAGFVMGLILTIYSCVIVFTDPNFWTEFDAMFQQMYGMSVQEYMELYQ